MRKIILALAIIFAMAVNISVSNAASVAIYDGDAESLFEDLEDELEDADSVSYTVSNFRATDEENFWSCDLSLTPGGKPEAGVAFLADGDEVFIAMVFCDEDTFDKNSSEIVQLLLITTMGMLEPCGLSESECDALLAEVMSDPQGGDWGTWSQGKYFRIKAINENDICGFVLSADDGN